jgi:hypothetical protein
LCSTGQKGNISFLGTKVYKHSWDSDCYITDF